MTMVTSSNGPSGSLIVHPKISEVQYDFAWFAIDISSTIISFFVRYIINLSFSLVGFPAFSIQSHASCSYNSFSSGMILGSKAIDVVESYSK